MTETEKSKRTGEGWPVLHASFSIEASYVMAIVLMALSLLIREAYFRCRQTTGAMRLHHTVELAKGQEQEDIWEISGDAWFGQTERDRDAFGNARITGSASGDGWEKEIRENAHEPENMMRLLTVFDGLSEGEGDNGGK